MPSDGIFMVFKAHDYVSGVMKTIASSGKGLSKEYEELERRAQALASGNENLQKKLGKLSKQVIEAKSAMKDAEKQFKATQDEADGVTYAKAVQEYKRLSSEIKEVNDASGVMQRSMRNTAEEMRKLFDESGVVDSGSGGFLSTIFGDGLGAGLAQSGIFRELGNSFSTLSGTLIESAVGQPLASALSETLSGTVSGAAAGAIAGIPGMIAGAITGTISGALNAGNAYFEQRDDAFKEYYAGLYDTVNANTTESLTSGKTLAAGRETTKLSFNTLLGSAGAAEDYLSDVLETANTTPFLYDDLVGISKNLLSFNYAVEDIIPTLTKVGDAGAALGLGTGDISTVATYLGRMKSSDKATLEYLNPLNERGFAVFQWLADDLGVSIAEVYEKISKSELPGTYVSDLILGKFQELYGGMMEVQARSTEGLDSTLQGLQENIQAAMGESYNQLRNESKKADIAAYGGALGDKLSELAAVTGQVEAYGENLSDQYLREALNALLLGQETTVYGQEDAEKLEELREAYMSAEEAWNNGSMEAGLKMTDLREEAEALATAAYESSEWYQQAQDAELDQITAIRENTAGLAAATNELKLSNEKTKGEADTWEHGFGTYEDAVTATGGDVGVLEALGWYDGSHAFGLKRVPYDGYLAMLHQDERVLTAAEGREADAVPAVQITVTGNSVRSEEDLEELVRRFSESLRDAWAARGV